MSFRVMATLLLGIAGTSPASTFGQVATTAQADGAEPARRAAKTMPTPEAKVKALKPLPLRIVGSPGLWMYDLAITGKPVEQGEVAAIAGGVVTLREGAKYFDVALADLGTDEQATIERMSRLLADQGTEDEKALLGSWSLYLPEDAGNKPAPSAEPRMKLIVSGSEIQLSGTPSGHWRLDSTKNPKTITSDYMTGIYEFKSGWLRVRFGNAGDYYPKSFEGKDEDANDTLIFRPLPDVKTLPPAQNYDPELKVRLEELIKLLAAEKYDEFINEAIPPQALKSIPAEKLAEMKGYVTGQKDRTVAVFEAILRVEPKISADGNTAQFDFSRIHVDGVGALFLPKALKADGKWYLANP